LNCTGSRERLDPSQRRRKKIHGHNHMNKQWIHVWCSYKETKVQEPHWSCVSVGERHAPETAHVSTRPLMFLETARSPAFVLTQAPVRCHARLKLDSPSSPLLSALLELLLCISVVQFTCLWCTYSGARVLCCIHTEYSIKKAFLRPLPSSQGVNDWGVPLIAF
jgi:hypothetical protein